VHLRQSRDVATGVRSITRGSLGKIERSPACISALFLFRKWLCSLPRSLCAQAPEEIFTVFFVKIWPNDGFCSSTSRDCVLLFRQRAKQGRSLGPRKLRAREPASRPKLWTCTSEAVAWFRDSLCPTLFRRMHQLEQLERASPINSPRGNILLFTENPWAVSGLPRQNHHWAGW